ncbi:hypothetical protein GCM10008018_36640 [Paenibacillus marchantiophytorum]|uniref:Cell division protein ZapA n=1 Tax=Paenibacillus marchantiophytorum TaxID=1619310 RepID=A0ABQ1ETW2_9BACL|nr:hypothetical protein [Paenibacillus marchantiophytorum]GFZ87150.1 hypothetical protein GCM10008018_36640 [Paenibacillus marchantiophytorum]
MGEIARIPIKTEVKARKRSIYVQDAGDVKRLMNSIINDLRNGDIDSKSANAIGYLTNIILKTIEVEDVSGKLYELEKKLEEFAR